MTVRHLALALSTAPTSPETDQLWYDKTNEVMKRWDGTAWVLEGTGTYSSIGDVTYDGLVANVSAEFADAGSFNPGWLSRDGEIMWNYRGGALRESRDGGATFTVLNTFARDVLGVRELGNGELLVSIYNDDTGGFPGELWISSGYPTDGAAATWTKTRDSANSGTSYPHEWALDVYENLVFAIEYGTKVVPNNARFGYVSDDHGATWRQIYEGPSVDNAHAHGIAYDPWRDRVWITQGDTPSTSILYSDNWRDVSPTWTVADDTRLAVGVMAFPDCVLLTPDDAPAGLWRIPINADGTTEPIEDAYEIGSTFTHIGMTVYRRQIGYPAYFAIRVTPGVTDKGYLLATVDGQTIEKVWEDTITYDGGGLFSALGPTVQGNVVGTLVDSRFVGANTRMQITAPAWSTGRGTGTGLDQGHAVHPRAHKELDDRYPPISSAESRFVDATEIRSMGGGAVAALLGSRIEVWNLRASQSDQIRKSLLLPSWWTTFQVEVLWAVDTVVAGDVQFAFSRYFKDVGESLTTGEATTNVAATVPATAAQLKWDTLHAGLTNEPGELFNFRLARLGATDGLALTAHVVGLKFTRVT